MNKRILFIVSITTFIIILAGFSVLTIVTRKMIQEAIKEQVIMDNKAIGGGSDVKEGCFEHHTIEIMKNDRVYLFSDGYAD